ncbi:rod shape-determining protein MreC [Ornithinimicrobium faecis]|uniref:Cell shape-determining protein MreC n=1 Tax=Ornithinimicrobium faecis TaxID=2934158 RepID=A0ABY4YQ75_9MICO|nr:MULTISPECIES: rod shape-determining protein MreC [unclassified Ornithinimicrobium]USQ78925.1 rod shape-determining protein MreC [Ornithinimicrobium sp. HY1793]
MPGQQWWRPEALSRWLQERPGRPSSVLLAGLLALTMLLLLVDVARPTMTDPLRRAAATVFAPAQSALTGWTDDRLTEVTRERDQLDARVKELEAEIRTGDQLTDLEQAAAGWGGHELLPARVVGFSSGSTPVGGQTVTIDAGEGDGVTVDQTVVSSDGLVGRVVRTAPSSADVVLIGGSDVVVGVRFGEARALGSVGGRPPPGLPPRASGELTLTALGDSEVTEGDLVSTLGSPDSIPYVEGIPLGSVTSVDPEDGSLGGSAVVSPFVDPDTLDLVAVVLLGDDR